jgi:hypothetical protein
MTVQRERLGDRRDDVPEVVGQQVGAAHEHRRAGDARQRPAARLGRPVAKPVDQFPHPLAGFRGDVAAAVEHPGDGRDRQPGLGRDGAHRHPARSGNKI